jgi:uncharacterized protein (TIGR02145 family)
MKHIILFGFLFLVKITFSQQAGTFIDARNKKDYKTVVIGTQTWMVENLNVSTFRNGDPITLAKSELEWENAGKNKQPAWCYIDFDESYSDEGKLYNWYAVDDKRGIAPLEWHIPSDEEWLILIDFLDGTNSAGKYMKSKEGWSPNIITDEDENGTNESGFDAKASGHCDSEGTFHFYGIEGSWWCNTKNGNLDIIKILRIMGNVSIEDNLDFGGPKKERGYFIRCLKD